MVSSLPHEQSGQLIILQQNRSLFSAHLWRSLVWIIYIQKSFTISKKKNQVFFYRWYYSDLCKKNSFKMRLESLSRTSRWREGVQGMICFPGRSEAYFREFYYYNVSLLNLNFPGGPDPPPPTQDLHMGYMAYNPS